MGFPDSSVGKEYTCNARDPWFNSSVGKILWIRDRGRETHIYLHTSVNVCLHQTINCPLNITQSTTLKPWYMVKVSQNVVHIGILAKRSTYLTSS